MISTVYGAFQFASKFVTSGVARLYEDREARLRDYVLQNAVDNDPDSVLSTIDSFCWNQRWMMHLGDEKRTHLERVLKDAGPINTALELGLYCGYSATAISRYLVPGGHLYSIEPSAKHRDIASIILEKAGVHEKVRIVPGKACDVLQDLADQGLVFDFVFIDHQKSQYLSDLKLLEEKGLMREGTVVVADNIIIFQSKDYLDHVRDSGRYKSSELCKAHVEYDKTLPDGIEVSVYAGQQ